MQRQAQRTGHTVVKSGNCFVAGSELAAVNRVARRLVGEASIERLRAVGERWLYSTCLVFGLTREEQQRSRFAYQYSVFQLELSRNLLFTRGTVLDEVYQKLIDRTRSPPEPVSAIAGIRSCGGRLRVIASIEDPAVIERILDHLGRVSESLDPAHPSRAPPDA